ncbi:hypothetical protein HU200_041421 [Digitaria exilis]|uniref:Uncharacterized protein n=1 Tax=Digitaria exilis TaxID=1010633 RepID=A0A835EJ83_9POAL|nr:hypothetical protein HU200_041421 [Digitaria exilis]
MVRHSPALESTPFARRAGHVDPNRAVDPGLVYDAGADDYLSFLCALGYTDELIAVFRTKDDPPVDCSTRTAAAGDHNYIYTRPSHRCSTSPRARNVEATYTAKVSVPAGVRVMVRPQKLRFSATKKDAGQQECIRLDVAIRQFGLVSTMGTPNWAVQTILVHGPWDFKLPSSRRP